MITIETQSGIFVVNDENHISRHGFTPSGGWVLVGAAELRFGRVCRFYTVDDIRRDEVPWQFKNGKQRCYVVDRDCGTTRLWMSPVQQKVTVQQ